MRIFQRLLEPNVIARFGTQGVDTRSRLQGASILRREGLIRHYRDRTEKDDSGEFNWSIKDYEQAVDDVYGPP